jgi:hypothetical protein
LGEPKRAHKMGGFVGTPQRRGGEDQKDAEND